MGHQLVAQGDGTRHAVLTYGVRFWAGYNQLKQQRNARRRACQLCAQIGYRGECAPFGKPAFALLGEAEPQLQRRGRQGHDAGGRCAPSMGFGISSSMQRA